MGSSGVACLVRQILLLKAFEDAVQACEKQKRWQITMNLFFGQEGSRLGLPTHHFPLWTIFCLESLVPGVPVTPIRARGEGGLDLRSFGPRS
jgi:hypothetical protein